MVSEKSKTTSENEAKVRAREEKKAAKAALKKEKANARKEHKKLSQRVDEWNIREDVLDNILNLIIALVALCVLLTIGFLTLSYQYHFVTILMPPALVYICFSSPSVKLRMREKRSTLILGDILAIAGVLGICLVLDSVFFRHAYDPVIMTAVCIIGLLGYLGFIFRQAFMYYLIIPFSAGYSMLLMTLLNYDITTTVAVGVVLAMVFLISIRGHQFYFGIGRAFKDGAFLKLPEAEAKVIRAQEKERVKKLDAEIKQREREKKAELARAKKEKKESR